jgi:MFS family permease
VPRASEQMTQASSGRGTGATVKERWAFAAAAASLAVLFMGNNLPSALYGLFRMAFGYSSLTQTLLYAVPVVLVILPGLLVFGTLSDMVGRRAPIVTGLAVFAAGDVAFMAAAGTGVLFAARLLQGTGIALATAAAAATLSDCAAGVATDRVRAQKIAAVTGTICITGGLALGPLMGGILAQYAPDPRVTPFAVHLVLVVICIILAARIPGRPGAPAGKWRLARLHVPGAIRPGFPVIAVSGFLAWSVLGVFSAVIATLMKVILHTGNLAITAGTLTLMIGTSVVAQIGAPRLEPVTAQWTGLTTLAAGLLLLVAAAAAKSAALAVPALIGSGVGHGLIFAGNQSQITVATPAEERGTVLGVVYFINYLGLGVPVIIVGVMSLPLGLLTSTSIASVVIAAACVLLIPFAFRARAGEAS